MEKVHTSYHKGTTVHVIFEDGRHVVDKFEDHKSGCVVLRRLGRVRITDIRYIGVNKPLARANGVTKQADEPPGTQCP